MTDKTGNDPGGQRKVQHIVLCTIALLLPSILWMVFGWASSLLPLLVFILVLKYGWRYTNYLLMIAVPAALIIGFVLQSLVLVLFTAAMLPAGYMMANSASRGEPPWLAGMKGWLTLVGTFFLFFSIVLLNSDASLFQGISESLTRGIDQALQQYRLSDSISGENYLVVEQYLNQVKRIAPLILPGILGSLLLLSSWITLILGNRLLPHIDVAPPWQSYSKWTLPDKLVWILIGAGIGALFFGNSLQIGAVNILILVAVIYGFQGLAIVVFFFSKWNVPRFVRVVLYVMIMMQSFGTLLLVAAGVADVWLNFRRISDGVDDNTADPE